LATADTSSLAAGVGTECCKSRHAVGCFSVNLGIWDVSGHTGSNFMSTI